MDGAMSSLRGVLAVPVLSSATAMSLSRERGWAHSMTTSRGPYRGAGCAPWRRRCSTAAAEALPSKSTLMSRRGRGAAKTRGQTTRMPKYSFLSDEWVDEARRIYAEAESSAVVPAGSSVAPVRVNLIVTEAPFSSANLDAHVDTSAGRIEIGTGHVEGPDVTVSLDYVTARSLFVQGDVQAVLQAFLGGRIKVDGDLSKLLDPRSGIWPGVAPAAPPNREAGDPAQGQMGQQGLGFSGQEAWRVATRLQEITE
jgi:hypothetical protein